MARMTYLGCLFTANYTFPRRSMAERQIAMNRRPSRRCVNPGGGGGGALTFGKGRVVWPQNL